MKLLTKKQLAAALGLRGTRLIDMWVKKRMIPIFKLGHRSRFFDLEKTQTALARFEQKEVGRK